MTNNVTPAITPVDIARDVLKLLDAKKIIAEKGDYFNTKTDYYTETATPINEFEKCYVCGLGALFVARLYAEGRENEAYSGYDLNGYFSRQQQDLIERTFEGWVNFEGEDALKAFFDAHPDADDRLRAICENIIANDGLFVLP